MKKEEEKSVEKKTVCSLFRANFFAGTRRGSFFLEKTTTKKKALSSFFSLALTFSLSSPSAS